jgi:hypothetical protein
MTQTSLFEIGQYIDLYKNQEEHADFQRLLTGRGDAIKMNAWNGITYQIPYNVSLQDLKRCFNTAYENFGDSDRDNYNVEFIRECEEGALSSCLERESVFSETKKTIAWSTRNGSLLRANAKAHVLGPKMGQLARVSHF